MYVLFMNRHSFFYIDNYYPTNILSVTIIFHFSFISLLFVLVSYLEPSSHTYIHTGIQHTYKHTYKDTHIYIYV